MTHELSSRERRYIDAYLELERSPLAPTDKGAADRVIEAAFADVASSSSPPPVLGTPGRPLLWAVGLGLCAAAVVAWWVGSTAALETSPSPIPELAPYVPAETVVGSAVESSPPTLQPAAVPDRAGSPESIMEPDSEPEPEPEHETHSRRPRRRARGAARPAASEGSPTASATLTTAEVALLDRARRLGREGKHSAALATLREHARTYPASLLAMERAAEEVAVLCRMGADSATSARAELLATNPPEYLRRRIARACSR